MFSCSQSRSCSLSCSVSPCLCLSRAHNLGEKPSACTSNGLALKKFQFLDSFIISKNFKALLKNWGVCARGVCVWVQESVVPGVSDACALELQASVNHLTWVPVRELGSSARAVCPLSRRAVSRPAHPQLFDCLLQSPRNFVGLLFCIFNLYLYNWYSIESRE